MPGDGEAEGADEARQRRADWDGAWKRLVTSFPEQVLGLVCGLDVEGVEVVGLPTELPRPMFPDLVFRLKSSSGAEADRLAHLEVQTQPDRGFELRLATYFVLLAHQYKMVPHQVVIMPAGGPFTGRYRLGPLSLDYQVVDVTDLKPGPLLDGPLAPLALWSAGHRDDQEWPAHVVEVVADRIRSLPDGDLQVLLAQLVILKGEDATSLLFEALERRTMSNVLENTAFGRRVRREVCEEALLAVLEDRFGDASGLEQIAERLAAAGDFRAGLKRIRAAASLEDLRS